jgi:hypothetical protein
MPYRILYPISSKADSWKGRQIDINVKKKRKKNRNNLFRLGHRKNSICLGTCE